MPQQPSGLTVSLLRQCLVLGLIGTLAACAAPSNRPPSAERPGFVQVGVASWYGEAHQGRRTASGEPFDMRGMTAAHRTLPLGTIVRITNLENGRVVKVRITDRGPYAGDRVIDVSAKAAAELGMTREGIVRVRIEELASDQPLSGTPSASPSLRP